ncbi:MAG: ABC transporter permease [Desulfobacula sp.]|nr:ABC transporter permease [Desulfobacula sp.]
MLLKFGIKNVFRNKRRTILSGLAIGVGLTAMIVTDGFMIGMMDNLVGSVIETFTGDGQIHARGFKENFEVEKYIKDVSKLVKKLEQENKIKHVTSRTQTFGMISSPDNYVNIGIVGIESKKESKIIRIQKAVKKGTLPFRPGDIAIGQKLAKKLEVKMGDKVVVTVAQAFSEDLAQEQFRVSGILEFGSREFDSSMAFIKFSKAQEMLNLKDGAHEIVLKFHDKETAENVDHPIWEKYSVNGLKAQSWKKLAPEIMAMMNMIDISTYIISIIVFILSAIIIINTLFMSFYDRMFEFGVLRSIGTRPGKIIRLILIEASALSAVSIICGFIITAAATAYLSIIGIDYGGVQVGETTMTEPIYFVFRAAQFTAFPASVFILSLMAAIYPAIYASKITIVKAMDKSL